MANLNIRNLSDKAYKRIKERASRNKRSMNSEIIYILNESLDLYEAPDKKEPDILNKILKIRKVLKEEKYVDPVKIIRTMRDKD